MAEVRIACPKCDWEPDGKPYWSCTCGHVWNTFDTGGRCPACKKQWEWTQCVVHAGGCLAMSPHLDWYRGLDEWLEEEISKIEVIVETS
ncbi:hypothetical protein [Flavilitoribacter nigricans]|uniref:Uncharacterized protein n=1 Tax=Flavilitoribacter nigricans (strain ATCC 23147 / DSM 23189 / NBRC 102662 / NCIMB 1420 / SS-2) TaxID=1122177 RepID=A0A2D0NCT9_FLAN2|nr:hypothetical protein [Flavilitoribacter nigricans]PHN06186.1 hypothetical protein CRP01_11430 [Flavilitoribacter nigricans DSM 23189 = NBRC 102662]